MPYEKTYAIIKAIYDSSRSYEEFERQLDLFLSHNINMIIIEPELLGEVTWRWIRTGNWLHKTAVISGMSALTTAMIGLLWSPSTSIQPVVDPFGTLIRMTPSLLRTGVLASSAISATAAASYALFWQWDPCCKYQVASSLAAIPKSIGSSPASLVNAEESPDGSRSNQSSPASRSPSRVPLIAENRNGGSTGNGGPPLRPVVLIRRDDSRRKLLHNSLALSSTVVSAYIIYRHWYALRPSSI